jgi:hypothetical protein
MGTRNLNRRNTKFGSICTFFLALAIGLNKIAASAPHCISSFPLAQKSISDAPTFHIVFFRLAMFVECLEVKERTAFAPNLTPTEQNCRVSILTLSCTWHQFRLQLNMAHKPNYAHPQVDTPIDKILIPIAFPIIPSQP